MKKAVEPAELEFLIIELPVLSTSVIPDSIIFLEMLFQGSVTFQYKSEPSVASPIKFHPSTAERKFETRKLTYK